MQDRRSRRRDEAGFTMIEMMLVMVVLGVLAGIVTMAVSAADDAATDAVDEGNDKQCASALAAFSVERGHDATGWTDIAGYFEPGTTDPGCVY